MSRIFTGRVWKFGDDIDTDLIIPGFALYLEPKDKPQHCFSANRSGWVDEVLPGDVIVAGRNFGVGSGRPIGDVFVSLGIAGILAETFNGLGLRNCVNAGLPVLPCPGVTSFFDEGDIAEVDWTTGDVGNLTKDTTVKGEPVPKFLQGIVVAGGVEALLREEGYLAS